MFVKNGNDFQAKHRWKILIQYKKCDPRGKGNRKPAYFFEDMAVPGNGAKNIVNSTQFSYFGRNFPHFTIESKAVPLIEITEELEMLSFLFI